MKSVINRIDRVKDGVCYVSLDNMRADISQCIKIKLDEIPSWYGIDSDGYSVAYSIEVGVCIYFDTIIGVTRKMVNPRFTE